MNRAVITRRKFVAGAGLSLLAVRVSAEENGAVKEVGKLETALDIHDLAK